MGTYRLHTLVSGSSVWKSRKISRKKTNLSWCCHREALLGTVYLARYFLLFLFGVSFIRSSPSSLLRAGEDPAGGNSQCWILAQESSGAGGVGALSFHTSKHPSPCFALGGFVIFLLFEEGSPRFAISCTQTITSLRATLCCCARRKNVNLNKPPSQWYLKTDCRISSHFCKALFKNNSYIFIFQLVNREFFQNRGCFLCYSVMSAW